MLRNERDFSNLVGDERHLITIHPFWNERECQVRHGSKWWVIETNLKAGEHSV